MATLSVTANGYTSLYFSITGMSSGTLYPRKYEFIVNGTVKSTKTDSVAGTTSVDGYVYGLTANTTYTCYVYIYNKNTGGRVAVLGPEYATTKAAPSTTVTVPIINYLEGNQYALTAGSVTGSVNTTFKITSKGTKYDEYSVQYEYLGFRVATNGYATLITDISADIVFQTDQQVQAYYKRKETNVTITGYCGVGVSSFYMSGGGKGLTVTSTSTGIQRITVASGSTIQLTQIQTNSGYGEPYQLFYNKRGQSGPSGWQGPASGSTRYDSVTGAQYFVINSTDYDRDLKIDATLVATYPYTQVVYVGGVSTDTDTRSENTSSQVRISNLSLYQRYIGYSNDYEFLYARVGSSSRQYASYETVDLFANTTTTIYLYFQRKIKSVAPVISSVSTTRRTATITWSKNGGQYGSWILYYGTSTSSMQSMAVTSSPVTVSGLSPGQTYIFYVRNSVSPSDYKDSSSVSAATLALIGAFAWTSSDDTLIVQGQPIKNLTASAWSILINKVSVCGGATASIPTAAPGAKITESHFNRMRSAILNLAGAGSITDSVSSGSTVIKAAMFANHDLSLKNAINRAITNRNSQ